MEKIKTSNNKCNQEICIKILVKNTTISGVMMLMKDIHIKDINNQITCIIKVEDKDIMIMKIN